MFIYSFKLLKLNERKVAQMRQATTAITIAILLISVVIVVPAMAQGFEIGPNGQAQPAGTNQQYQPPAGTIQTGEGTQNVPIYVAGPEGQRGPRGYSGSMGPKGDKGRHGMPAWIDPDGNVWKVVPVNGEFTGKDGNKNVLIGRVPEMGKGGEAWVSDEGVLYWVSSKMIKGKLVAFQGKDNKFYYEVKTLSNIPQPPTPPSLLLILTWYTLALAVLTLIVLLTIWIIHLLGHRHIHAQPIAQVGPQNAGQVIGVHGNPPQNAGNNMRLI